MLSYCVLLSTAMAVAMAQFGRQNTEKPTCQCAQFDGCVQRYSDRFNQCSLRTCSSQTLNQTYQAQVQCFQDVPAKHDRFIQCMEQQIGKKCEDGFPTRGKRQATYYQGYPNFNQGFNRQFQDQDSGASVNDFFKTMGKVMEEMKIWKEYNDCVETCVYGDGNQGNNQFGQEENKMDKKLSPYFKCAKELNCKVKKPEMDKLADAAEQCSQQLGIRWRDEMMSKCQCLMRAKRENPQNCEEVRQFMQDIQDGDLAKIAGSLSTALDYIGKK